MVCYIEHYLCETYFTLYLPVDIHDPNQIKYSPKDISLTPKGGYYNITCSLGTFLLFSIVINISAALEYYFICVLMILASQYAVK
jgi:hypothetical protein